MGVALPATLSTPDGKPSLGDLPECRHHSGWNLLVTRVGTPFTSATAEPSFLIRDALTGVREAKSCSANLPEEQQEQPVGSRTWAHVRPRSWMRPRVPAHRGKCCRSTQGFPVRDAKVAT